MSLKIAINGFGRIGRATFKNLLDDLDVEIVAINDLTSPKILSHLLKYDSVYGIYEKEVKGIEEGENGFLIVDGKKFQVFAEKDPEKLPWEELGIDVVLECTGFFTNREGAEKHLKAGVKKVIISAPPKSEDIKVFVLGCNENEYDPKKDNIISNGSCTTNCLAPVAKVLNDNFSIVKSLATTIHSYTSTQKIVDSPAKDLRRARAAAINIVPTTTGAAKAVVKVLPELMGRLDAVAVRVPTPVVSIVDFVALVTRPVTTEEVNEAFKKVSKEKMRGILAVSDKPLVSTDYQKNPYSAIVDSELTMVQGKNLIKVLAWYDNEWGYACRLAEMAKYIGEKI